MVRSSSEIRRESCLMARKLSLGNIPAGDTGYQLQVVSRVFRTEEAKSLKAIPSNDRLTHEQQSETP
jgi:hypothetical protein